MLVSLVVDFIYHVQAVTGGSCSLLPQKEIGDATCKGNDLVYFGNMGLYTFTTMMRQQQLWQRMEYFFRSQYKYQNPYHT